MKIKTITIVLAFAVALFASDFKKNGTAGFTFLELPVTARAVGMGESAISLSDLDAASVFTNPGSLGFTNLTYSLSSSYGEWFADIKNYGLAGAWRTDMGVFAISSVMLDYGSMPRTVKSPGQRVYEQDGTFGASSTAIGLTYSRRLTDRFSFGLTAKYVNEKIDIYNASNIVMDAGMIYYTGLKSLRIGAAIQNFGTNAKFINSEFKMPAILRMGAAAELFENKDYRFTLSIEALHPTDSDEKLNAGFELELIKAVYVRGGYKFFYDEDTYSFGLGFKPLSYFPASVDFSYADYGRLGSFARFSLQIGME